MLGKRVSFDYDSLKATGVVIHVSEGTSTIKLDPQFECNGWTDRIYGPDKYWSVPMNRLKLMETKLGNKFD
jgi:hypothetical protein